jgi:Flp pilus assembly secretin CpaC
MPEGSSAVLAQQEPEPEPLPASEEDVAEARRPQAPVEIAAAPGTRDFNLRATARELWEQVTKAYGLEVIFDGDYDQAPGQPNAFHITEADYRTVLNALMAATNSFFVPVSERLLLIVKDTEQKRREVENSVAFSVPIPEPFTVQDAQELGRTVQQVMEIQRFGIDSAQRLAIFRDRVSKAVPARILFEQLMYSRAQIELDVELYTAAKTSTIGLGLEIPTSWPIVASMAKMALTGPIPSFMVGIGNITLLAKATKSDARTVYRGMMRASDGQTSTLQVGEKYPIMTLGYIGEVPPGSQAYTPPPSFNFEDLGLTLKITPKVHGSDEVSLDIDSEFKLLGAGSLNGIPIISNRKFATRARLRFDEAAVISGLVGRNDFRTNSGLAGVSSLPVLGPLLSQTNWQKDDVQLLLVIKPRLLTLPPSEMTTREIWIGSESRPRIPL